MSEQSKPQTPDPETGELPVEETRLIPWYKTISISAIPMAELIGNRPPVMNLRDHPELSGREIAIVHYHKSANPGQFGDYVFIGCFLLDADHKAEKPIMIMTGSKDVLERIFQVADVIAEGQPVLARLTLKGQAWIID